MKKAVEKMQLVEEFFCNICEKPVNKDPFNTKRIDMIRGLFKTTDFHAHDGCINKIVREAFQRFITPTLTSE